ncbi:MAG: hypothetical protein ACK4M3_06670, partial [Pyrobaculum sp.]
VTYYAHTNPDAWKALLRAGWSVAKLRVTNAFPTITEYEERVTARGKLTMDTSIVVVWRRGCVASSVRTSELYDEMVEEAAGRAGRLIKMGVYGRDLLIGTLAASLSVATKYCEVRSNVGVVDVEELVDRYVYPATYEGLARAFAAEAHVERGVKSSDAMFYLLAKSLLRGAREKVLESTDLRIFAIGTSFDINEGRRYRLWREGREGGARVAKANVYILVEPTAAERSKMADLLAYRGLDYTNPRVRCVVDALHLLEYYALSFDKSEFRKRLAELEAKYQDYVEEARRLAHILASVLPSEDPEKTLCQRVVNYLSQRELAEYW